MCNFERRSTRIKLAKRLRIKHKLTLTVISNLLNVSKVTVSKDIKTVDELVTPTPNLSKFYCIADDSFSERKETVHEAVLAQSGIFTSRDIQDSILEKKGILMNCRTIRNSL